MKKVLIGSLVCANLLFADIPESINFHSIAFNDSGNALANSTIAVKIELLDSSSSALYVETNSSVTTDSKGLFTLKIGTQTATTGVFSQLNFAKVAKIKVSADLAGGTNYTEMGTQDFSTVPFAFVAKSLEGNNTVADQEDMIAIGRYNTANNTDALFAVGNGTSTSNRSDAFVVYGDGNVSVEENLTVGGKLFVNGTEVTSASSATILNSTGTSATGTNALAWGKETNASNNYSTAMGEGTKADQDYMTAIGKYNTANNTDALFAVGNGDSSNRSDAFVVYGDGNVSVEQNLTVGGKLFVNGTEITSASSTAILNSLNTSATATNALAWGADTTASGTYSTVWGKNTVSSGTASTAWGYKPTASGDYSTAWGGLNTNASGDYSTAWGYGAIASEYSATAWGSSTTASAMYSTAFGSGTKADQIDMTAIGKYNTAGNTDALFAVGNGADTSNRSDAFVVYGDGNVSVEQNLTVGGNLFVNNGMIFLNGIGITPASIFNSSGATVTATNALAWGKNTTASSNHSTAWGYYTEASGSRSTAWGEMTTASALGATAWGASTTASSLYSTALGSGTTADQVAMTAIGVYNTANNTNALFVVGNGANDSSRSDAFSVYNNGSATLAGTLTQNSDERLKTNIKKIDNSIEKVKGINGVTYNWIDENKEQSTQVGVIAQDVQRVMPELVREGSNGYLSVSYTSMVGLLIEAIKEQQKEIEEKDEKINKIIKALNSAGITIEE